MMALPPRTLSTVPLVVSALNGREIDGRRRWKGNRRHVDGRRRCWSRRHIDGGHHRDGVGSDGGPSGDWTDKDNKLIPSKTWLCTEFEFKGDTDEFHVWWDDVERTALRRGPAQHAAYVMPQFTSLWFGYWMYNMTEPQELWIDEIAVDYKPIGCAK